MLGTDEMEEILVELMAGKEPTITGPEAHEFREKLKVDIENIKKQGYVVDIPSEIPG